VLFPTCVARASPVNVLVLMCYDYTTGMRVCQALFEQGEQFLDRVVIGCQEAATHKD